MFNCLDIEKNKAEISNKALRYFEVHVMSIAATPKVPAFCCANIQELILAKFNLRL